MKEEFSRKNKNRLSWQRAWYCKLRLSRKGAEWPGNRVSTRWLQLGVSRDRTVVTEGPKDTARAALFPAHTPSQHKSGKYFLNE